MCCAIQMKGGTDGMWKSENEQNSDLYKQIFGWAASTAHRDNRQDEKQI